MSRTTLFLSLVSTLLLAACVVGDSSEGDEFGDVAEVIESSDPVPKESAPSPDELLTEQEGADTVLQASGSCQIVSSGGPVSYYGLGRTDSIYWWGNLSGSTSACRQKCNQASQFLNHVSSNHEWTPRFYAGRSSTHSCYSLAIDTW